MLFLWMEEKRTPTRLPTYAPFSSLILCPLTVNPKPSTLLPPWQSFDAVRVMLEQMPAEDVTLKKLGVKVSEYGPHTMGGNGCLYGGEGE